MTSFWIMGIPQGKKFGLGKEQPLLILYGVCNGGLIVWGRLRDYLSLWLCMPLLLIPHLRISPLGVILEKSSGEFRLNHLSYPAGNSASDSFVEGLTVVTIVATVGRGSFLGKCDVKLAFWLLPIFPGDFNFLGFAFQDSVYMDMI